MTVATTTAIHSCVAVLFLTTIYSAQIMHDSTDEKDPMQIDFHEVS